MCIEHSTLRDATTPYTNTLAVILTEMKTYILDIIPKIQRFSQKLNETTILQNKHWVILSEESSNKVVFIFREKNNQLLISNNGIIEKGTWDYIGNNSIMIDRNSGTYLFKHGFIDQCILALKVDGKEEYALLVNEEWFEKELRSIEKVIFYLNNKYLINEKPIKITFLNNEPNDKINYSEDDLIYDINKRVKECVGNQFKDILFLRGVIVTLSMRVDYKQLLARYQVIFDEDLCNEIKLNCPDKKKSNYILEPLINKGITNKI